MHIILLNGPQLLIILVKVIVERLLKSNKEYDDIKFNDHDKLRDVLLNIPIDEFFIHYAERASYEEIPLLTADGVVIPKVRIR